MSDELIVNGEAFEFTGPAFPKGSVGKAWAVAMTDAMADGAVAGSIDITAVVEPAVASTTYSSANATTNNAALATAATAAVLAGHSVVYVPEGTFYVDGTGGTGALYVTADLTIKGSGPGSKLKFGPDAFTTADIMFYVADGVSLTLEDLTIEGHTSGIESDLDSSLGIFTPGGGGTVTLRRVHATRFYLTAKSQATPANGQSKKWHFYDCDFKARSQTLLTTDGHAVNGVLEDKRNATELIAINCTFDDDVDAIDPIANPHHNLYIASGVAVLLQNCRFLKSSNRAIRRSPGNFVARFNQYIGCFVAADVTDGFETAISGHTEIIGCRFEAKTNTSSSIMLQGGSFLVSDCAFRALTGTTNCGFVDDSLAEAGVASDGTFKNCTFGEASDTNTGGYLLRRTHGNNNIVWRVEGCKFYNTEASFAPVRIEDGRVIFNNCSWHTTTGSRAFFLSGGVIDFNDCLMVSATKNVLIRNVADITVTFRNLRQVNSSNGPITYSEDGTATAVVNIFNRQGEMRESSGDVNAIGLASTRVYLSGKTECRESQRSVTVDTGVVTFDLNTNVYSIGGSAATIETFEVQGDEGNIQCWDGAVVYTYCEAAHTFDDTDNLVPKSTSARTTGDFASWKYIGSLSKWFEI